MTTLTTPAIAGAAQAIQRPGEWTEPADAKGPIELMVDAARAAADDAGAPALLSRVGWIGVAGGIPYRDPGRFVGERIGAADARTALSMPSGSSPQELVGIAAERIALGQIAVALVLGGDASWNARKLKADGEEPRWTRAGPGEGEPEVVSAMPREMFERLGAPADVYAIFEDSLRMLRGESQNAHRGRIAALWAGFSAVAATNPYAWDTTLHTAGAIREPSADNRMIAYPYTKAMVANNTVNMASALLLCSVEVAEAAGIARDKLVFPHAVTTSHETWKVGQRDVLHGTPALKTAGNAALSHAGIGADDLSHIDLYACFPSIVQMSADALGLDVSRPLTVTGGLGFAGAPLANAAGQSIAAMVPLVRAGGWGFVHANGGYATKHAFGVYANQPPQRFVREAYEDAVEHHERELLPQDWDGSGKVEAATVVYGREAPSHVLAAVRSDDGRRGWARSQDGVLIAAAMNGGIAGTTMRRAPDGTLA